ncbi:MAG: two pore domain potassium channel family protein [Actinobacteria bacterium]|nr:MAG: two pore domain potassium channel family protein [Actinomycetota bacterium]
MHVLVGALGAALILLNLAEFFVVLVLPRRVKRGVRLARRVFAMTWIPGRALARRLPGSAGDSFLGILGPLGLFGIVILWALGVVVGFAALQWAGGSHVVSHGSGSFLDDLYFSGGAFLSASSGVAPHTAFSKVVMLGEAATGLMILFIVIGYLPALYDSFSRREVVVSQLDPRAGSPPSAGAILMRSADRGGWEEIATYLGEWDNWAAELMETHLSYPILGYYRSQHLNQSWLAALTTVVDTSAFAMATAPAPAAHAGELTFAIGRHALADLAYTFRVTPHSPADDRLPDAVLHELCSELAERDLELTDEESARMRLTELRRTYEPYANALAEHLAVNLPSWMPAGDAQRNWEAALWQSRRAVRSLP